MVNARGLQITNRRGLLRAVNAELGTARAISCYVGCRVENDPHPPSPATRLIFRHNNGVGQHVTVVRFGAEVPEHISRYMRAL